jgi:hypothetical protein
MSHSYSAVWLACQDPVDGPRLLELARQHMALVKERPVPLHGENPRGFDDPFETTRDIFAIRIQQIREERDGIIAKYEQGDDDE